VANWKLLGIPLPELITAVCEFKYIVIARNVKSTGNFAGGSVERLPKADFVTAPDMRLVQELFASRELQIMPNAGEISCVNHDCGYGATPTVPKYRVNPSRQSESCVSGVLGLKRKMNPLSSRMELSVKLPPKMQIR
jgi:hypothetical protein